MAIEVELPDGTVAEFPDGTPPETIKSALSRRFNPGASARPSLFRADSDFREASGAGIGTMLGAAAKDMFGSRESAAQYLAKQVGGEMVDSPDGPLLRLKDGQTYRLNDPGLDNADVANVAGNVAAMTPAAKLTALGGNLLSRIFLGATTAAATDAGLQAGFKEEGDAYDPTRTMIAGAGGAAGEVLAPIIGKVAQAVSRSPAKGDARAAEILRRDLGIEKPTTGQVQAFSRALDEIDAGADPATVLGSDEFGFIYTRGQRLPEGPEKFRALSQEERIRQDQGMAGDRLRAVEQRNRAALENAVGSRVEAFSGQTKPQTPVEAFEGVTERVRSLADRLQGKVGEAYDVAGSQKAAVSADAVRQVPDRLRQALRDFPVGELTPGTRATLENIQGKIGALGPDTKGVTLRAIEEQRRILNNSLGAAANPTDRAALRTLKAEYDRWLDDAFESALVSGDEQALASMKEARGLRAEFGRRFEGDADVDKFIQQMIAGDKTPDELLNVALGASQVSKASAARYVERLKAATDNDPEVLGALRAAHLMRLTQGKNGEVLGAQAIRSNILNAERNTPSVIRSLYDDGQWAQLKQLAQALEPMVPRGDFARSSGTGERIMRMIGTLPFIGRGVELIGKPVRMAQAEAAVGRLAPLPAPRAVAASGGAAGAESQRR